MYGSGHRHAVNTTATKVGVRHFFTTLVTIKTSPEVSEKKM